MYRSAKIDDTAGRGEHENAVQGAILSCRVIQRRKGSKTLTKDRRHFRSSRRRHFFSCTLRHSDRYRWRWRWPTLPVADTTTTTRYHVFDLPALTLLGPQSRFGDKLLILRVVCPHIREWGSKRVNAAAISWQALAQTCCSRGNKQAVCFGSR